MSCYIFKADRDKTKYVCLYLFLIWNGEKQYKIGFCKDFNFCFCNLEQFNYLHEPSDYDFFSITLMYQKVSEYFWGFGVVDKSFVEETQFHCLK